MPIIIDNSLLQPEEPQDDSAFGYAMMGLVEGVGKGIEHQQAQQEEQARFEREKAAKLDLLGQEQAFKKELFSLEQEANKPLMDLRMQTERLQGEKAALDIEAARRVAEDEQNARRNMFRSRYAEAFGDGNLTIGNQKIDALEQEIVTAEQSGDAKKAAALRAGLTREGERIFGQYQAKKSQEYTAKVLSSDLFKSDEALSMEAQAILNRSDLDVIQKAESIRNLEKTASAAFEVTGLKTQFQGQVQSEIDRLSAQMTQEQDPVKDEELQAQINDLVRLQGQSMLVAKGDTKGMQDLINFGRQVMFRDPRESLRSQRGAKDSWQVASEALNAELNNLDKFLASGAIDDKQLQAAYQAAFAKAYGTGAMVSAGAATGGQDSGAKIRNYVTGEGGGGQAIDFSGKTLEERKAFVQRINAEEKYRGLSASENKLRDDLQASIQAEEKGAAATSEAVSLAKESDQSLKGLNLQDMGLDAALSKHGRPSKFSLSKIANKDEAQMVQDHLISIKDEMEAELDNLQRRGGVGDAASRASLIKQGIKAVERSIVATKRMMNISVYPGARK